MSTTGTKPDPPARRNSTGTPMIRLGTRREAIESLRRIGGQPDGAIDLAEGALALAALARPAVAIEGYRDHLRLLADDVGEAARGRDDSLGARVEALGQVLAGRHG